MEIKLPISTGANGQAAQSCQAKYLTLGDQFAIAVGAQPSVAPLSFAWVTGGTSYFETATLYNPFGVASAVARFNVEAPVANARVVMEDYANFPAQVSEPNMNFYPLGQGQNGMNTFEATAATTGVPEAVAGFFGADPADDLHSFTPGAQFIATPTNMADFSFNWVQVLTTIDAKITETENGKPSPAPGSFAAGESLGKLDNTYPYNPAPSTDTWTYDNPRWVIPQAAPIIGGKVTFTFVATMWYMCTPKNSFGAGTVIPVPLAKVDWNMEFTVEGVRTDKGPQWETTGRHSPSAEMAPTVIFPEWSSIFHNGAAANAFELKTKFPKPVTVNHP